MGFADDLNALNLADILPPPLMAATYCYCAAGAPCGNVDPTAGCANSTGAGALLTPSGSSSVGFDDLVLTITSAPPNVLGIVFMGGGQTAVPFGDGQRCVASGAAGTYRFGLIASGPTGTFVQGPGMVAYSVANFGPAGVIVPGSTWSFQGWFRDPPGPCGNSFNLSNAAAVTFVQ